MYDISIQIGNSSETFSFNESDTPSIGSDTSADIQVPKEIASDNILKMHFKGDQVSLDIIDESVTILSNDQPIPSKENLSLPSEFSIGEIKVSISLSQLNLEDVTSLIDELENSHDQEAEDLQNEIERLTSEEELDSSTESIDDLSEISNMLAPQEKKSGAESAPDFDISSLIDEASSSGTNLPSTPSIKEKPEPTPPSSETSDTIEFSDDEPDIEAQKSDELEEKTPLEELVPHEEAPKAHEQKGSSLEKETPAIDFTKTISNKNRKVWKVDSSSKRNVYSRKWPYVLVILIIIFLGVTYVRQQESVRNDTVAKSLSDLAMITFHRAVVGPHEILSRDDLLNMIKERFDEEIIDNELLPSSKYILKTNFFEASKYKLIFLKQDKSSNFAIAAIPHSSFYNVIFPLNSYFIDSKEMVLHSSETKLSFIEEDASTALQIISSEEYENFLKNGRSLAIHHWEKTPSNIKNGYFLPDDLERLLEESPARIYQLPRYYKASSYAYKLLSDLTENLTSPEQTLSATKYFRSLYEHPYYIFYNRDSLQRLAKLRNELGRYGTFFNALIMGSVSVNSETGEIDKASILSPSFVSYVDYYNSHKNQATKTTDNSKASKPIQQLEKSLKDLKQDFEITLTPIKQQLVELISSQNKSLNNSYPELLNQAIKKYLVERRNTIAPLKTKLRSLYDNYVVKNKVLTSEAFFKMVEVHELTLLTPDSLKIEEAKVSTPNFADQELKNTIMSMFNQLQNAETLDALIQAATQLDLLIRERNFVSPEEYTIQKKRFQTITLNQVEIFLRKNTAKQENVESESISIPSFASEKIDTIFQLSSISPEVQSQFYNGIFDDISSELRDVPHQSYVELMKETKENIETPTENNVLEALADAAIQLPLKVNVGSSADQELIDISRIGIQVYLKAADMPPSQLRDKELNDAISLMKEGLSIGSDLWQNILESHKLILQHSSGLIENTLKSNLGFSSTSGNMLIEAKTLIKSYEDSRRTLFEENSNLTAQQAEQFKPQLDRIKKFVENGLKNSDLLRRSYALYLNDLTRFERDYKEAQAQGFFISNRKYQTDQLESLVKKCNGAKQLDKPLNLALNNLEKQLNEILAYLNNQYQSIETKTPPAEKINTIMFNEVPLGKKIQENLNIAILPIP